MTRPFWIASAALAFVLLLAIGFLLAYDRVIENERRPPQRAALAYPYLAAERMLERLGVPTGRIGSLADVALAGPATLLMPARRGAISASQLARLERHVRQGGHLVVESEPMERRDPVLEHFGIERSGIDWEQHYDYDRFGWEDLDAPLLAGKAPLWRVRLGEGEPLVALLHGGEALAAPDASIAAGTKRRAHLIGFALGAGRVTAINDLQFARNWQIGRNDHAELLWRLANWRGEPAPMLIYRGAQPSLGEWLIEHALPILVALALLLVLALWRALPRLGPIAPDPEPARRRLLDHLAASGRLLWAAGQRGALVEAARRRALATARTQHPHLALLPPAGQAELLVSRYGIGPALAAQLVGGAMARDDRAAEALIGACRLIHAHGASAPISRPTEVQHR